MTALTAMRLKDLEVGSIHSCATISYRYILPLYFYYCKRAKVVYVSGSVCVYALVHDRINVCMNVYLLTVCSALTSMKRMLTLKTKISSVKSQAKNSPHHTSCTQKKYLVRVEPLFAKDKLF